MRLVYNTRNRVYCEFSENVSVEVELQEDAFYIESINNDMVHGGWWGNPDENTMKEAISVAINWATGLK